MHKCINWSQYGFLLSYIALQVLRVRMQGLNWLDGYKHIQFMFCHVIMCLIFLAYSYQNSYWIKCNPNGHTLHFQSETSRRQHFYVQRTWPSYFFFFFSRQGLLPNWGSFWTRTVKVCVDPACVLAYLTGRKSGEQPSRVGVCLAWTRATGEGPPQAGGSSRSAAATLLLQGTHYALHPLLLVCFTYFFYKKTLFQKILFKIQCN